MTDALASFAQLHSAVEAELLALSPGNTSAFDDMASLLCVYGTLVGREGAFTFPFSCALKTLHSCTRTVYNV
jgi:hypothetical protein